MDKIAIITVDSVPNKDFLNKNLTSENSSLDEYYLECPLNEWLKDVTELSLHIKNYNPNSFTNEDLDSYIKEIMSNTNIGVSSYFSLNTYNDIVDNYFSKEVTSEAFNEALVSLSSNEPLSQSLNI
jgi:hypothetical protein